MAKKAKKTFSATVIKLSTIGDEGTPTGVHLDNFFRAPRKIAPAADLCESRS